MFLDSHMRNNNVLKFEISCSKGVTRIAKTYNPLYTHCHTHTAKYFFRGDWYSTQQRSIILLKNNIDLFIPCFDLYRIAIPSSIPVSFSGRMINLSIFSIYIYNVSCHIAIHSVGLYLLYVYISILFGYHHWTARDLICKY